MKSFYLILIALVTITVSCKKAKEGAPGPAGIDAYPKQGYVYGTVTFTDEDNKPQTTTFNYQYYESLSNSQIWYDTTTNAPSFTYKLNVFREDLKDSGSSIKFSINGTGANKTVGAIPSGSNVNFYLLANINKKLYSFYYKETSAIITNMKFNFATNQLTYDFTLTNVDCGVNKSGTVIGKVDVIVNYSPYNNLN
ncbi:hypothetical protein [uncultured Cytophaga sp.]|uniref:hypothetical protein n=1 Tax=uncultured Cytophaga sp. TaxID=160238 RepID=UPI00260E6B4C|nr:hypothetical protein [uncultured Cytophaga sp.]